MEHDELRRCLGRILTVEEQKPTDWPEVDRLTSELMPRLHVDATPEIVNHYLDDGDIRARDEAYAERQRRELRRFVETGAFDDGTPIPRWGWAIVLLALAGFVLWMVL